MASESGRPVVVMDLQFGTLRKRGEPDRRPRITCVTSGQLCMSPRVVREADALVARGFNVTVISAAFDAKLTGTDRNLATMYPWQWRPTELRHFSTRLLNKTTTTLARAAERVTPQAPSIRALAHSSVHKQLAREAIRHPADVYIGHNLPGLVASVMAAKTNAATVLFDVEDWHPGELNPANAQTARERVLNGREVARRESTLDTYLAECDGLIASSDAIAEHLKSRYRLPVVNVRNACADQQSQVSVQRRVQRLRDGSRRCYWFSQTIGLDRGLEDVIPMLATSHPHISLSLQGTCDESTRRVLDNCWSASGGVGQINYLPLAEPHELAAVAGHYDIGLSLETNRTFNRSICLTNKVFAFLEWGMPQMVSDTPSQRAFCDQIGAAGLLINFETADASTKRIKQWLANSQALVAATKTSASLYRHTHNYERESEALFSLIEQVIPTKHFVNRAASYFGSNHPVSCV